MESGLAQRQRVGPITQRSEDRNLHSLTDWSYGVVVSTRDFESRILGSNPSKTFIKQVVLR